MYVLINVHLRENLSLSNEGKGGNNAHLSRLRPVPLRISIRQIPGVVASAGIRS